MRAARAIAVAAVLAMPAIGEAAPRPALVTIWAVQPPVDPIGVERTVSDGEMLLRQRLLPTGLATLDADIDPAGTQLAVKTGTQLVRATMQSGRAYCALETLRRDKKTGALSPNHNGQTLCLIDADSNGRFEAAAEMPGGTGLLMVSGALPKTPMAIDAGYSEQPVEAVKGDFWVGLRYEQYFNIYGNRMIFTDYGGRGEKQSLTDFAKFKSKGTYPQTVTVSGATVTVLGTEPKSTRLRIDAGLPARPFAVFSYTTTTVIPIYH